MFKSFEEARSFIDTENIKMVDFMMVDLNGRWRHLTIPADRFTEDTLKSGIGFDGSNYGFAPVEKSDMVFIPDAFVSLHRSIYGNTNACDDRRRLCNRNA